MKYLYEYLDKDRWGDIEPNWLLKDASKACGDEYYGYYKNLKKNINLAMNKYLKKINNK